MTTRNAAPPTALVSRRSPASLFLLSIVASSLPIATLSFSGGSSNNNGAVIARSLASHRRSDGDAAGRRSRAPPSSVAAPPVGPSHLDRDRADGVFDHPPPRSRRSPTTPLAGGLASASLGLALLLSPIVLTTMTTGPGPAWAAYDGSADYASETVTDVVTRLRSDAGDIGRTFGILEDISKIITEGKGVGGTLTYGEFWLSHPPCGTSSSLRRTERVVILWYRFLFAIRVVRVAIPPASLEKPHATHTPFLCTLHNDDREIQTASSSARVSS